jgi:uncharacterized membrane protein YbjE (DUF340 family)
LYLIGFLLGSILAVWAIASIVNWLISLKTKTKSLKQWGMAIIVAYLFFLGISLFVNHSLEAGIMYLIPSAINYFFIRREGREISISRERD